MSNNISIIIPNYNGAKFLSSCLKSIYTAASLCPSIKFEIIVVDNNSTDNSLDLVKNAKVIKNNSNFGFAKAVNQGINAAKYKYVCLLNNDLTLDKNWFKLITKTISTNQKVATFCGTVLNSNGTKIESQGFKYFMSGKCENIGNGQKFLKIQNDKLKITTVWGSSSAAVIYDKNIIQKVGLFDESFFAYIEDVDLCYRLAKHGHITLLTPHAISYHLGGQTSSNMGNLRVKSTLINWIKLIKKNYSLQEIFQYLPGIISERLRNLSYYIRSSIIIRSL